MVAHDSQSKETILPTHTYRRRAFYSEISVLSLLFLVMVLAPLYIALIGHEGEYRGFWIEFGVGLGFVGIAVMGLQFVLTARFKNIATSLGTDALLNFHRQAGYSAYFFILGHVIVLIIVNSDYLSFFDPGVNAPRAFALSSVIIIMTLLVVLTIWRKKLRIPYEWWRISHAVFAFLILFIGLAHILMVGFYIDALWKKLLWVVLSGTAMAMLIHVRLIRPYKMAKKPYRVTDVVQEAKDTWTLEVEPAGHDGILFKAGQFAWLTIGPTPFSIQQHPFSFSSSCESRGTYSFTIKELGDFSSTIKAIKKDTPIYLEGPFGGFTLRPDSTGAFFVIGGIGITPVMSMLRTLRDRRDKRPLILIYGNPDWDSIAFKNDLSILEKELNLSVYHVFGKTTGRLDGL